MQMKKMTMRGAYCIRKILLPIATPALLYLILSATKCTKYPPQQKETACQHLMLTSSFHLVLCGMNGFMQSYTFASAQSTISIAGMITVREPAATFCGVFPRLTAMTHELPGSVRITTSTSGCGASSTSPPSAISFTSRRPVSPWRNASVSALSSCPHGNGARLYGSLAPSMPASSP